jgi:hypothetical protein
MNMPHKILGLVALAMLALAAGAQAQMYSQIGGTGTVVAGSYFHNAQGNAIFIDGGNETRIVYNVTNPRDTSSSPFWTTLQILAVDGGPFSTTNARLVRIPRTGGSESTVCSLISTPDGTVPMVYSCTFSSSLIDFANFYYYVRVSLTRMSLSEFPAIYGIRVF